MGMTLTLWEPMAEGSIQNQHQMAPQEISNINIADILPPQA
jgi:hypothetical protein